MREPPKGFVFVPCLCDGRMPDCQRCAGTGQVLKKQCPRCLGGTVPGKCPDCRDRGWLEDHRG